MPTISRHQAVAPFALAIDVGSSSVRALLFDRHGDALAETEEQVGYDLRTTPDGGAEFDADRLFDLTVRCVDGALARAGTAFGDVAGVGISCFWHSLLGLDRDGKPVTPVLMWADTRSAPDTDELRRTLDEAAVHDRTGCVLHSSYWPAKLHWLRRTDPERFTAVHRWCAFSDWLLRRFFGADQTSVSMASGTGLLDVRRAIWDAPMVDALALDSATLPPIAGGEPLRGLLGEWSSRWPALVRVPWLPGIGDGACANVGAGAVVSDRIALTVGTTGAMRIVVDCPAGGALSLPPDLWAYRLDHERAVIGAAISNGGLLMSWLSELVGVDFDDQAMADAALLPPDAHGLTLLPFLAGERSPIWNDRAHGVVAGLTLHTSKADLLRAGMEAVAYRFARLHRSLAAVAAPEYEIVANGGAILRSPAWLQIVADTLGRPLFTLPPTEEASARGAAIMALAAAGLIEGIGDVRDPVDATVAIGPIPEQVLAYEVGLLRQTALEMLLFPKGTDWQSASVGGTPE